MLNKMKKLTVAAVAMGTATASQAAVDTAALQAAVTEAVADAGSISAIVIAGVVGIASVWIVIKLLRRGVSHIG